jgi:hypothetical protein
MQEFEINFQFFGKKFKTSVKAVSRHEAENKVRELVAQKIVFYKPTKQTQEQKDDTLDFLKNIFNFK